MNQAYFVTGTDTEIGKTFVTCALLRRAAHLGLRSVGVKPIAAGTDAAGNNEDVEAIRTAASVALPPEVLNPYCFAPPIAPHLAAAEAGVKIDFGRIQSAVSTARAASDFTLVEGVGGFRVPLGVSPGGVDRDSADLAGVLGLPLILVVGLRLGCINHALLTAEAIAHRGQPLAGWVANSVSAEMSRQDANIASLEERIPAPLLGVMPYAPDCAADWLRLPSEAEFRS